MTTTITISDTDARGVRAALGFAFTYYRPAIPGEPANFTGVIIERVSDSASMLSTTNIPNGRADLLTLTDTQYNALVNQGRPSALFLDFIEVLLANHLRDHALSFDAARKQAQTQPGAW